MMNDMSLKAKVHEISKNKKISAQVVLQNYMMRSFLFRLRRDQVINVCEMKYSEAEFVVDAKYDSNQKRKI